MRVLNAEQTRSNSSGNVATRLQSVLIMYTPMNKSIKAQTEDDLILNSQRVCEIFCIFSDIGHYPLMFPLIKEA